MQRSLILYLPWQSALSIYQNWCSWDCFTNRSVKDTFLQYLSATLSLLEVMAIVGNTQCTLVGSPVLYILHVHAVYSVEVLYSVHFPVQMCCTMYMSSRVITWSSLPTTQLVVMTTSATEGLLQSSIIIIKTP